MIMLSSPQADLAAIFFGLNRPQTVTSTLNRIFLLSTNHDSRLGKIINKLGQLFGSL